MLIEWTSILRGNHDIWVAEVKFHAKASQSCERVRVLSAKTYPLPSSQGASPICYINKLVSKVWKKARHKAGLRSEERLFWFVTPHSMRGLFGFENGDRLSHFTCLLIGLVNWGWLLRLRGRYDSLKNQSCNSHKPWLSPYFGMVVVDSKHLLQYVGSSLAWSKRQC